MNFDSELFTSEIDKKNPTNSLRSDENNLLFFFLLEADSLIETRAQTLDVNPSDTLQCQQIHEQCFFQVYTVEIRIQSAINEGREDILFWSFINITGE